MIKTSAKSNSDRTATAKSKKSKKSKPKEDEIKQLEEEAKAKQEQEAKEKLEQEMLAEAERKKKELFVAKVRADELKQLAEMMSDVATRIQEHHAVRRAQYKWDRYMKCDGLPNPNESGHIYTFLTLWKEENEQKDFAHFITNMSVAQMLIDELEQLTNDNVEEAQKYKEIVSDLQAMSVRKIDQATYHLLCSASANVDPETLNFSYSRGGGGGESNVQSLIHICLWANLSHNPRIKDHSFGNKELTFNLPRPLTLAHVAFRCVFMGVDYFSPKSRTYACRVKEERCTVDVFNSLMSKPVESEPVVIPLVAESESKESTDLSLLRRRLAEEDDEDAKAAAEAEAAAAAAAAALEEEKRRDEEEKAAEAAAAEELKNSQAEAAEKFPDELEILKELSDSFVVDLRNYAPLGPILDVGLFNIPPQPKKIKQWTITQKEFDEELVNFNYPASEPNLAQASWDEYSSKKPDNSNLAQLNEESADMKMSNVNGAKKSEAMNSTILESTLGADDTVSEMNKTLTVKGPSGGGSDSVGKLMKNEGPLHIFYKIPLSIYVTEEPMLARWDKTKSHWRTDEILDYKYNVETRDVDFKTYHMAPYCLLQDRHVHMPLQSWRMVPRAALNTCMFTVETANFEIHIEIKLNKCRVYVPVKEVPVVAETAPVTASSHGPKLTKKESVVKDLQKNKQQTTMTVRQPYEPATANDKLTKAIESFANKWYSVDELKRILRTIGLNVFPEADSDKFVNTTSKNKPLESFLYQNMALCSCLSSFAFSKWNAECDDENKIVMLAQLHVGDQEPQGDAYKCVMCATDLFYLMEVNEFSDEFDTAIQTGTQEHVNMYNVIADELCKDDSTLVDTRIKQMDAIYYETCLSLIESLKPATFS